MILRRSRFAQLVDDQLDLFEREEAELLASLPELLERYNQTDRDEAEEAFGDYADAFDVVSERLEEMRDHYARSLDEPDAYIRAFNKAVRRRMPQIAHDFEDA